MIQAYKHYLHILLNTEQVSEDELKEASIIPNYAIEISKDCLCLCLRDV